MLFEVYLEIMGYSLLYLYKTHNIYSFSYTNVTWIKLL